MSTANGGDPYPHLRLPFAEWNDRRLMHGRLGGAIDFRTCDPMRENEDEQLRKPVLVVDDEL
ncbi:MAG: hypothetical protein NT069_11990 [Planctomycetota bacterium]|nr:hypothetical protein [Planctomycetota bacterium]